MRAKTKRMLAAVLAAVMILPGMPYGDGVLVANASNVSDSLETDKEVPEEEKVSEDENAGNEEKPDGGNGGVTDTPGGGDVTGGETPGSENTGDGNASDDNNTGDGGVADDGSAESGETPDDETADGGETPGGGGELLGIKNPQRRETPQRNASMQSGVTCRVRTARTR